MRFCSRRSADDAPVLEDLAERLEHVLLELRRLVEERIAMLP